MRQRSNGWRVVRSSSKRYPRITPTIGDPRSEAFLCCDGWHCFRIHCQTRSYPLVRAARPLIAWNSNKIYKLDKRRFKVVSLVAVPPICVRVLSSCVQSGVRWPRPPLVVRIKAEPCRPLDGKTQMFHSGEERLQDSVFELLRPHRNSLRILPAFGRDVFLAPFWVQWSKAWPDIAMRLSRDGHDRRVKKAVYSRNACSSDSTRPVCTT